MSLWSKAQNYSTAAVFARRILALDPAAARVTTQVTTQARSIISQGDRSPQDALPTAYDHFTAFEICAGSLTPIYTGSGNAVKSLYSGASYKEEFRGEVCRVDEVSLIGGQGSGLRSKI
jgi:coatomer protein complex subunit alpha (xenin)